MDFLPSALAAMGHYRQFICFILVPSKVKPGKFDKFPVDHRSGMVPGKGNGGAHDPAIWTDHATAIAAAKRFGPQFGVGFVFTENDPFWFLDIDGCLLQDTATGAWDWSPLAKQLIAAFPGAAVEVSSSGKGLHIFGSGTAPAHTVKNTPFGLEFYTSGRFVALTGKQASGDISLDFTPTLPPFVAHYFPPKSAGDIDPDGWTDAPCDGWGGIADDDQLIAAACRSRSAAAAFSNRASFADLWERNVDVLSRCYPDNGDRSRAFAESEADAALAQHLAFWTGKHMERMRRLMLRSGLMREKYDRPDYLPRTIRNACAMQVDVMRAREIEPLPVGTAAPVADAPRGVATTGATFLSPAQQIELFAGCVYIVDANAVLVPGGALLKPEQFKVHFGGYSFCMDNANERTSRDAYEAFTQSQAFRSPRADSTCFKPTQPPGVVIVDAGRTYANVWWPIDIPRIKGDAGPFLRHVANLLPDARDQQIVLSYMAACIQHAGTKFQWAPLIQGAPGNGKTLLSRCVAFAVGRRYSHWPNATKLGEKFNSWLLNKLFYAVEDIKVADHQEEVIEALKPMITGDEIEIEGKGVNQVSADVCGNFIFNTNHKNGLRKTRDDRRFAVFYTRQQTAEDIVRDGMGGRYLPDLYDWLKGDGYAIVSEFLHTYPIPDEFNPATSCQRAPITSSTEEAIAESLGSIEQEIMEAIAACDTPGFLGGWVSSMQLDKLLKDAGRRIPRNKRGDIMATLGYELHPGLIDGRVNNPVMPDGGKPRLYVRRDHPAYHLVGAAAIASAYASAQMPGLGATVAQH